MLLQLSQAKEKDRILLEFLQSGLKARCRGGCGDLTFEWQTRLVEQAGHTFLIPICSRCARHQEREAKAAEEARAATAETAALTASDKTTITSIDEGAQQVEAADLVIT